MKLPDDLFYVWDRDDIDSSFYEDTDEPRPLFVCCLCIDADDHPDVLRGYDPRDGIFERGGNIVGVLGAIDLPDEPTERSRYMRNIEAEVLAEFQAQREHCINRGEN